MKSAAGRAFLPFVSNLSSTPPRPHKLRVGFLTINPTGSASPTYGSTSVATATKYLKIDNFDATHALTWYSRLYNQQETLGGLVPGTPLREALATAGWIYAGKMNTGLTKGILNADDPVQASCQRNFSILTTDGYWTSERGATFPQRHCQRGHVNNQIVRLTRENGEPRYRHLRRQCPQRHYRASRHPGGRGTLADVPRSTTEGPARRTTAHRPDDTSAAPARSTCRRTTSR